MTESIAYTGPRRALVSVSDKSGIIPLVREFANLGIEIVSTGGTAKAIREAGLACTDVSSVTGFPEMMDGRVKTLHPNVHGALLKIRGNPEHERAAFDHSIGEFDFVVVNLYPFAATIAKQGITQEDAVEQIDIGGPSMLRSGAKNFKWVTVIVDPKDYERVVRSLRMNNGRTTLELRTELAGKVFMHTGEYDIMIGTYLGLPSKTLPGLSSAQVQGLLASGASFP